MLKQMIWFSEVFFEDPEGREGIDRTMVPKRQWEGNCSMCKSIHISGSLTVIKRPKNLKFANQYLLH